MLKTGLTLKKGKANASSVADRLFFAYIKAATTSALIDGLKRGAPVLIVDRGRRVARLEPVTRLGEGEQDGRLSRLIREGIVRPAHKPLTSSLFTSQPPRPKGDA